MLRKTSRMGLATSFVCKEVKFWFLDERHQFVNLKVETSLQYSRGEHARFFDNFNSGACHKVYLWARRSKTNDCKENAAAEQFLKDLL